MKQTINLEKMGLAPMNEFDMQEIEGGSLIVRFLEGLAVGIAIAAFL